MARFMSKSAKYRVIVQGDDYMTLANGQRQQIRKPLVADFGEHLLTEDEIVLGMKSFDHRGLPEMAGTEEDATPRPRISGFDSERAAKENDWTAEEHDLVVQTLRNSHVLNVEFMELVPAPAVMPWPTYNSTALVDIPRIAEQTGTVAAALAYESENKNRQDLIDVLNDLVDVKEDVPVVIEA